VGVVSHTHCFAFSASVCACERESVCFVPQNVRVCVGGGGGM
jgi:hypothetical protein